MFEAAILGVRVSRRHCTSSACFRLFFSFFHQKDAPRRSAKGTWNCSVGHYPRFQHHLACNLETECEDGRNENEHCSFSSAECKGLVALCGHCYKFVHSLRDFQSQETDVNQRANEYCKNVTDDAGVLGMPKCVYSWCDEIRDHVTIHYLRLSAVWLGLFSRDSLLPNMYRFVLMGEDKTALYHFVFRSHDKAQGKFCYARHIFEINGHDCHFTKTVRSTGAICERGAQLNSENRSQHTAASLPSYQLTQLTQHTQSVIMCPDRQVTHVFLLCGSHTYKVCGQDHTPPCTFSVPTSSGHSQSDATHLHALPVPIFTCGEHDDAATAPYSLLCDFIHDCQDGSDEFCRHPMCIGAFTCSNEQCVPYDKMCDFLYQCHDQSDEKDCGAFREQDMPTGHSISPVLISFDGARYFTVTPMNSSDPCPDTHYRCPGALNDCLPVYTRCNGIYDCVGYHDEEDCEEVKCPGFFRCRASRICLHGDQLCDGWPHCPLHDDEMACDVICPAGCLCRGHTFLCFRPVSIATSSEVRSLDGTKSNITLDDVGDQTYLIRLVLSECSLTIVPDTSLLNLKYLYLNGNKLQHLNMSVFLRLRHLQELFLSSNPIASIYSNLISLNQEHTLSVLDLSYTTLTVFDPTLLPRFSLLHTLDLSFTSIHTISLGGFQSMPQLTTLHLEGSPVTTFPADVFKDLVNLQVITTQNYKLCCSQILPGDFDGKLCLAPRDEISSCKDLLQSGLYRGFLWVISCLSVTRNVFCFLVRLCAQKMTSSAKSGYRIFVTNLSLADFLMGVYIAVIGVADLQFRGKYLRFDDTWKSSVPCKVAGFLSLLSSEVSAFIIWLITLDRFVVLHFPFSSLRFQKTSAVVACLLTWLVGWFLAAFPLLPMTSHWEFYGQTGICIPLPVTRQEFKGRVSVLIILNFILFLFISAGQAFVYWSIQKNSLKCSSSKTSRDITIARRLITVAVTDFLCWFPIGLCGILALVGIPIPGEVNVALATFVLPVNAAINPFMYTFNVIVEKRRQSNQAKLLKWMESHADCVVNEPAT